jgi:uncharacterized transporter YbjL
MEPFYDILRKYPELAVFLTLAIGFYVGRLKISGCSIGSVTGVLLTGLVIGQIGIPISPAIKSVFFLFFLFAVGYVGACADARASTVALSVIQDAAQSRAPTLGFTVCFAVANTLLTIFGVVIVLLLQ